MHDACRSPRTNGFVERMNRALLDECFRVAGRTTWYIEVEEIQRDLDRFLTYYNVQRTHQGYRLKGRTPAQALCKGWVSTSCRDFHRSTRIPTTKSERRERQPKRNTRRTGCRRIAQPEHQGNASSPSL